MKNNKSILLIILTCLIITLIMQPMAQPAYAKQTGDTLLVGDYVNFGQYLDADIKWRVVEKTPEEVLLYSEYILTYRPYDGALSGNYGTGSSDADKIGSNYWTECNLRDWLNSMDTVVNFKKSPPTAGAVKEGFNAYDNDSGFMAQFTQDDFDAIALNEQDDHVFVLSNNEICQYIAQKGFNVSALATPQARAASEIPIEPGTYSAHWLRDPFVSVFAGQGSVIPEGNLGTVVNIDSREPADGSVGVRPAMYLNLEKILIIGGSGTDYAPYAVASSNFADTGYQMFPSQTNVGVQKAWDIKFNKNVDSGTLTAQNIKVVRSSDGALAGNPAPELQPDGVSVRLSPPVGGYAYSTSYTLIIEGIKSQAGEILAQPLKMVFVTVGGSGGTPGQPEGEWLETPVIHPNKNIPSHYSDVVRITVNVNKLETDLEQSEFDPSPVRIYSNVGGEWQSFGYLYDSGDLHEHGDEIRGDGIYSILLNDSLDLSIPCTYEFKIEATSKHGISNTQAAQVNIVQVTNGESVAEVMEVHENTDAAIEELNQELAETSQAATVAQVKAVVFESIKDSPDVEVNEVSEDVIELKHSNGITSMVKITQEKAGGQTEKGSALEDYETATERNGLQVPLDQQTTGVNALLENLPVPRSAGAASVNAEPISSRSILIWAPYVDEFAPWEESEEIRDIFQASDLGFNVQVRINGDADIDSLRNLTDYGFILLSTHGSDGRWLLTREEVKDKSKYELEQILDQIRIVKHLIITDKGVKKERPIYIVNEKWFADNLNGTFSNSVILNSSCESTKTHALWDVFEEQGAGAYLGFDGAVLCNFASYKAIEFVENLVNDRSTVGDAYVPETDSFNNTSWQLLGSGNLAFLDDQESQANLINGSFEQGLLGWQTEGDGRVITRIGNPVVAQPTDGGRMAIISTGLGYTQYLGSIEQKFRLGKNAQQLSFDWNYMSEEFLEFIGSVFKDPFKVTLSATDGAEEQVLYLNIDNLAKMFGTQYTNREDPDYLNLGGDLIHVSPDVSFDQGDVWMTGWQSHLYWIPEYLRDQVVTLRFEAVDEGDDIYDTAVLLDNIRVY